MTTQHTPGPWAFDDKGEGKAAFIVKATNCHDELLEALEGAERTLTQFAHAYNEQTDQADPLKNFPFEEFSNLAANALCDAETARAAIAKAKGETK